MQPRSHFQAARTHIQSNRAPFQNPRVHRNANPNRNLVHADERTWRDHMTLGGYSGAAEPRRQTGNGLRGCPDLPLPGLLANAAEEENNHGGLRATCPDYCSQPVSNRSRSSSRQKDDTGGTSAACPDYCSQPARHLRRCQVGSSLILQHRNHHHDRRRSSRQKRTIVDPYQKDDFGEPSISVQYDYEYEGPEAVSPSRSTTRNRRRRGRHRSRKGYDLEPGQPRRSPQLESSIV